MKKILQLAIIIAFCLLGGARAAQAFDETFTHPYLTRLIAEKYNQTAAVKLSAEDIDNLAAGSQAEDNPPARCLNHFYNPLNQEGLSVNNLIVGYAAAAWAQDRVKQAEPLFEGDFTWQQGLAAKAQGNNHQAYFILGHILHLIEDMGMPAHTRNDEHLEGDGLETWIKNANSQDLKLAMDLSSIQPSACPDLTACLDELARFSNANFFSDDTINHQVFAEPWFSLTEGADNYAYANGRPVAWLDPQSKALVLNDRIFRETWRAVAPRIIGVGLRIIDLFNRSTAVAATSPSVNIKQRGQISAGGVKIRADEPEIKFNWPKIEAKVAPVAPQSAVDFWQNPWQRFFPIIDVSKTMPAAFLNGGEPLRPVIAPPVDHSLLPVETALEPAVEEPAQPRPDETKELPAPPTEPLEDEISPPPPPTVDTAAPTVNFSLTPVVIGDNILLSWQAQDNISATSSLAFDLAYQIKAGEWQTLLTAVATTSLVFNNNFPEETTTTFKLRARDQAGNWSAWQTASTLVYQDDRHNPTLYENLEHLFSFSECSGRLAADSGGARPLDQRAAWIDGRWGCGVHQGYEPSEADGLNFAEPLAASELTLSFYFKDVSAWPITHSRNRFALYSHDLSLMNDWILAVLPTLDGVRVYVNGQEKTLAAMPPDHDWHHLAVVANADYLALYVDGVLVDQLLGDFAPREPIKGLSIVGENSPTDFDELAVWSRSLSSDEIMGYAMSNEPLKALTPRL